MTIPLNKIIKEIHDEANCSFTIDEIKELLELKHDYNKDTPVSTGKQLLLTFIKFEGVKTSTENSEYDGDEINFDLELVSGINLLIADNLKGKSSIFKIIKFALTGKNSLKNNIGKWINKILLNFQIAGKEYTIFLNLENRLKAYLSNGASRDFNDVAKNTDKQIIKSNNNREYKDKIQDFFFNQFSYYPLSWTQKASSKESTDLNEASTSWRTYFKSIYLESKDSNILLYGAQGNKVFQMLLGLELTYPINQLKLKKDILTDKKGKQALVSKIQFQNKSSEIDKLKSNLEEIEQAISDNLNQNSEKINPYYSRYNSILEEIKKVNSNHLDFESNIQLIRQAKISNEAKGQSFGLEFKRIKSVADTNYKKITDMKEYLEIGLFFSNLNIKHCPCCNNPIRGMKERQESGDIKCILCSQELDNESFEDEKKSFQNKIESLENENINLNIEQDLIKSEIEIQNKLCEKNIFDINEIEERKKKLKSSLSLQEELKKLEENIDAIRLNSRSCDEDIATLISQKAIVEYRIYQIEEEPTLNNADDNYDEQIKILGIAINKFTKLRYQIGEPILEQLTEIMLSEIKAFGLNSISKIKISENLDISYEQDGDYIGYDNIAEGEQLRVKLAFFLSLIQLDIKNNYGKHTGFLIIDSPGKEEGDENYLKGLSEILKSIQIRYGSSLQILIGTAERDLKGISKNELIIPQNEYVF